MKVTLAGTDNFNQADIDCDTSIIATDDKASGVKISTSKYGKLDQEDAYLFTVYPEGKLVCQVCIVKSSMVLNVIA